MSSSPHRIHRTAARVLPVSPLGEVLLMHGRDPAYPDDWHWVSIGGAIEPGESLEEGALRELREETGIVVAPLAALYTASRRPDRSRATTTPFARTSPFGTLSVEVDGVGPVIGPSVT